MQIQGGTALLSFDIEAGGYGAVLSTPTESVDTDLKQFLAVRSTGEF